MLLCLRGFVELTIGISLGSRVCFVVLLLCFMGGIYRIAGIHNSIILLFACFRERVRLDEMLVPLLHRQGLNCCLEDDRRLYVRSIHRSNAMFLRL